MAGTRLCSISGCNKPFFGLGYCNMHYLRLRRTGSPEGLRRQTPQALPEHCSHEQCTKPAYAKSLCVAHYNRFYRHGSAASGGTSKGEPVEWLFRNAGFSGAECLEWPYAKGGKGEAVVYFDGKMRSACAVMCEFVYGPAPTDLHETAHGCGKGHHGCINPIHLRWATRSENHMDKLEHGTHSRGERSSSVKLIEADVREIRRLEGVVAGTDLAKRFGVTKSTISSIHKRKNWGWLE